MGQISDLQDKAWENKVSEGFNTDNIEREFNYTYAELAEAYDAYRKATGKVGEELADTVIFLLGMAQMLKIDLENEILAKMKINEGRAYETAGVHHIKKENNHG